MIKRLVLCGASLFVVLLLSVGLDRVAGLFVASHEQGLNFPRNVSRHFQTPEFSFTVKTNSLGFRDREFSSQKTARTRILALGDSFTYGWGVEIDQSWPKVLERRLRDGGLDVEVANLGRPAGSPRSYADIAERAVPLLKPDLLIVAVLQGDDLAQMELPPPPESKLGQNEDREARFPRLRAVAKHLYPNFLSMIDEGANSGPTLTEQWKKEAQIFLTVFTPEEKARLEKIDSRARQAFLNGELNPALVYLSIHLPDYFSQTMDLNSDKVSTLVPKMGEQLARIQNVARQNNADVLIISMPYGIYVSSSNFKSRERLGFTTVPEMLTTNSEDEAIRSASQMAGVKFYEYTRDFRQASIQRDLFFELDGHLNAAGHNYFAEVITPLIRKEVSTRESK